MIDLKPAVQTFLKKSPQSHFWGGRYQEGSSDQVLPVYNPATGEVLAQIRSGIAQDVSLAVESAQKAFAVWSGLTPQERSAHLHRFADLLEKEQEELAQIESLDVGKAIVNARGFDIPFGIQCVRYYADLSVSFSRSTPLGIPQMEARVHRSPYGVCGFIFPWNFPFDLLFWGIIPALAAGNTVVIKPSEVTPLSTLYVAELAIRAGIPEGVINVVTGDGLSVGVPLSDHPLVRRMSFTGSGRAGVEVAQRCAKRIIPCKLELGGKGAAVLFEDVDLESAAKQLAGAITFNTGQVCCTASRWFVQRKILNEFQKTVTDHLSKVKIGTSLDETTEMGPLASQVHKNRVIGYFEQGVQQGASVLLAPDRMENKAGYYLSPFLLSGADENICFREEIFGPTAFISVFDSEEEVIDRVNSISYGLANSVWSRDLVRANRVAEKLIAGNSWINAHNVFAYGLPYGGVNGSGYGGGVNSPETFQDYFMAKTIARPLS